MSVTSIKSTPIAKTAEPLPKKTRLRPRRTLNRLALALVGFGAGAVGQVLFNQQSLWDGVLFYSLGTVLFVAALSRHVYPRPKPAMATIRLPDAIPQPNLTIWRSNFGIWLVLLALTVSFFSLRAFVNEAARGLAWWLYLLSLSLLVGAGLLLSRGKSWWVEWHHLWPRRSVAVGLILVLGLAAAMRLYQLDQQPFGIWFDEAEAGLLARQMLLDSSFRPIFHAPINITGHLLAIYALALNWLGDTIISMRIVSVLFGVGAVLAAYLFGRELHGPRFGLILAFLLAVARWHLNFSRIAMTGIDTPFFEFLSLFFLVRLLRRWQLRDAIWAGLSLGFGLALYTAFRLFALALLIFGLLVGLLWLFGLLRGRVSRPASAAANLPLWLRRWLAPLTQAGNWLLPMGRVTMLLIAVWLVIMPIAKFALDNPDAFRFRTGQVSIFVKRDQPDLAQALWTNTTKHLLMFNYKGDSNGRHNLPGEPMLDPAMGILAIFGLGLVLSRPHEPTHTFFLILAGTTLLGGILTVDFEAPQSLRSIAVMPAVIYFIGLALATLGREAELALAALPRLWLVAPALALAGFMFAYNAYLYFGRQAHDFSSWNAFSTPETLIARRMVELGPEYIYYLSPLLTNHPTTWFLAPHIKRRRSLTLSDVLPIREPAEQPVALFIHPDDFWVFEAARQLYPQAEFEPITGQAGAEPGPPIAYFANLQPDDLASIQGLDVYYVQTDPAGNPVRAPGRQPLLPRRVPNINAAWPDDSPISLDQPGDVLAEWNGTLYVPHYGPYGLRLAAPAAAWLEIDGNVIFDGQGEQITGLPLAQGNHSLRVRAEAAPGQIALYWQPPGQPETLVPRWVLYAPPITNHGLLGSYYANDRWTGQPAFQRIDAFLDSYFHLPPLDRPYTVEWTGALDAPESGLYELGLRAITEAQLFIDGKRLVSTPAPDKFIEAPVALEAGLHDIRIRFKDDAERSRIHLAWTRPGGQFEPIPARYLQPSLGEAEERSASVTEIEVAPLRLIWRETLGGPGSDPGQFAEPRDVAVLANGHLVIADTGNRRVQIVTPEGEPGQILTGDDLPFAEPLAVAVNSRDEIVVLDSTNQWLYRYDSGGTFIDHFGGPGAYLFHPRGLTIFDDDTVAVADTGKSRLLLFSPDGLQAGLIGAPGTGPGQFDEPTGVLRDQQGYYFVVEARNNRIQRLDPTGKPLNQWAIPPAYSINGPQLALGPDGSIFVTESQSKSLLRYAPDGTLLNQWRTIGPVTFAVPVGLHFEAARSLLFVTDIWTHQIYKFEVQR